MKQKSIPIDGLSRREFILMTSVAAAGLLWGCAANPVTGRSQLMLMSEDQEIAVDKSQSPHQFSSDYGFVQDKALGDYVSRIGKQMTAKTHRTHMPYRFKCVNANYVNAYAFPGGSIACTRGILLTLENEAELAALLGHELGHVNARHTAEIMSKSMVTSAVVGGLSIYAGSLGSGYGQMASQLGQISAGALLATYSRDNERQADSLGMEYMVRSGYSPEGMIGLMGVLNDMNKHKMSTAQVLFATHPMSSERYKTAVSEADARYAAYKKQPVHKDRYMDHTVRLRKKKGAIEKMQKSEAKLGQKKYSDAETLLKSALKQAPDDYVGLLLMAKCQLMQDKDKEAERYADKAKKVYPDEAQAYHISGITKIRNKKYEAAHKDFSAYDKKLPGNPNTTFYKGLALEGMEKIEPSAREYYKYLQAVNQGKQAQYAYKRLKAWGYIK